MAGRTKTPKTLADANAAKTHGTIEAARGGQFRAYYNHARARHTPGMLFATPADAVRWLNDERSMIERGTWTPPAERRQAIADAERAQVVDARTFGDYAREWIATRTTADGRALAPKTTREYRSYLDGRLAGLAARPLAAITRDDLDAWWQDNGDKPTARQHAYVFAKSVFKDATDRGLIGANPCQVVNAARRARVVPKQLRSELVTGLSVADVDQLVAAMDRESFRAMLLLVAYCGLRPGEVFALTRADIERGTDRDGLPRHLVRVTKAVSTDATGNGRAVGAPKTADSIRTVPLPPHLAAVLDDHLARHAQPGDDGLVFPSTNPGSHYATPRQVMGTYPTGKRAEPGRRARSRDATGFAAAREAIGRPTLRIYDLRHWARRIWTLAGLDYASVEMLLGHTLPLVQGSYAHLDHGHVWPYAVKVSELAGWTRPGKADPPGAPRIDPRLLAAMTPEQLRVTLAGLSDAALTAVVPTLPADVLARAFTVEGGTR